MSVAELILRLEAGDVFDNPAAVREEIVIHLRELIHLREMNAKQAKRLIDVREALR